MRGEDQSYTLLTLAQELQEFALAVPQTDMAALALIERAKVLRTELHVRLMGVTRDERDQQMALAQESYQDALDHNPSASLAAIAHFGLGLCREELDEFDEAAKLYHEVVDNARYAGTTAQAAAAYRLKIMDDFRTDVVFKSGAGSRSPAD